MKLEFVQGHTRDVAALRTYAEARVAHYSGRHPSLSLGEHFRWVSDRVATGSYKGGTGTITLGDREVRVVLDLPFFARPFRARIESFIRSELALALGS